MAEFIKRLKDNGVKSVPSIANSGRINGFAFVYEGKRIPASHIHYSFGWKRLKNNLDYNQKRDAKFLLKEKEENMDCGERVESRSKRREQSNPAPSKGGSRHEIGKTKIVYKDPGRANREYWKGREVQIELESPGMLPLPQVDRFKIAAGHVYIMASETIDGLKVGYTKHDPNLRAQTLSNSAGTPSRLKVIYSVQALHPKVVEKEVHRCLHNHKLGREFFKVCLFHAVWAIVKASRAVGGENVELASELDRAVQMATRHRSLFQNNSFLWSKSHSDWVETTFLLGHSINEMALLFGLSPKKITERLYKNYPLADEESSWGEIETSMVARNLSDSIDLHGLSRKLGRPLSEITRKWVFLKACKRYLTRSKWY